jgi:hypothetical protein
MHISEEINAFDLRSYSVGSERKNLSDLWQNVGHDCGQEVDANDAVDRYSDHSRDNSSCRSSCFLFQVLDVLSIHDAEPKERLKEIENDVCMSETSRAHHGPRSKNRLSSCELRMKQVKNLNLLAGSSTWEFNT